MLSITQMAGFGSLGRPATLTYLGSTTSLTDTNQPTFPSCIASKGGVKSDRYYIIAVTIDSVALGNTTVNFLNLNDGLLTAQATKLVELTNANGALTSIWICQPDYDGSFPNPALGDTLSALVTLSQVMQNCTLHLWEAVGINPTPTNTYTDTTGNPSSFNMNVPANSVAVAALTVDAIGSGTITWTNLSERFDAVVETSVHSVADGTFLVANAALAVSAQHSGAATIHMLCAAVFASDGRMVR